MAIYFNRPRTTNFSVVHICAYKPTYWSPLYARFYFDMSDPLALPQIKRYCNCGTTSARIDIIDDIVSFPKDNIIQL